MKGKLIILILVLFACITPVAGFEDTFQDEELFDDWEVNDFDSPYTTVTASLYNDNPTFPTSDSARFDVDCASTLGAEAELKTKTLIPVDYISFTVRYQKEDYYGHCSYFVIYDINGNDVCKIPIIDVDYDSSVQQRWEFIKDGRDYKFYINGNLQRTVTGERDIDVGFIGFYYESSGAFETSIHFDDVSTKSVIGTDQTVNNADEYFFATYGLKYKWLNSDSNYTLKLINNNDLRVLDTITLNDYHGREYWNVSETLGSNFSMYKFEIQKDGETEATNFFAYTDIQDYGSVNFDSDAYVLNEDVDVLYSLVGDDFTSYDYEIEITNLAGKTIDEHSITSNSGTYDYVFNGVAPGSYLVLLSRTSKTTGNEELLDYDYTTITDAITFEGTTYLFNESIADNASVSLMQGSTYYNTTSDASGQYNKTDLSTGVATTFNATTADASLKDFTFTPKGSGVIQQDLVLFPNNMTDYWGVNDTAAYGLVYGADYNPVSGATVTISNSTYNATTTANSVGVYQFHNLSNTSDYTLTADADGYDANSVTFSMGDGNTRQDIQIQNLYTVTVMAKSHETGGYISEFTAFLGNQTKLSEGAVATFENVEYGAYIIGASADNYYSNSAGYVIDSDKEIEISLSEQTQSYYDPSHYVTFYVKPLWGTGYSGVDVKVYDSVEASTPSMESTTGSGGSVGFDLDEDNQYRITFNDADRGINEELVIHPTDETYTVYVNADSSDPEPTIRDPDQDDVNYLITSNQTNLTTGYINITSESNLSTSYNIQIINKTGYVFHNDSYNTTNLSYSQQVEPQDYIVVFEVNHPNYPTETIREVITFSYGVRDGFDLGFEEHWQYQIIALLCLCSVGGLFGSRDVHIGGLAVMATGWIMFYAGWVPATPAGLTLAAFGSLLPIIFILRRQEDG